MKLQRLSTLVLLLVVSTISLYAQYEPEAKGELIKHTNYCLDYNEDTEQANWTYYVLTRENLTGVANRKNNFKKDPKVSTGSAEPSDYTKTGYDRGHLVPAASMSMNQEAMNESFYMSNMSPQHPSCNRGMWKQSEEYVRDMAGDSEIYVLSGPILEWAEKRIGKNEVLVPTAYFKIAYDKAQEKIIAFIIPNQKADKELDDYRCSVDVIEEATGIDFFYQLEDELEAELEYQIF